MEISKRISNGYSNGDASSIRSHLIHNIHTYNMRQAKKKIRKKNEKTDREAKKVAELSDRFQFENDESEKSCYCGADKERERCVFRQ